MRKKLARLKHVFFAHKGNRYRPTLLAKESVALLALALFVVEGIYLAQTGILYKKTGFLATVLPAALTTLANADRAAEGAPALVEDPALDAVAQAKVNDMAAKGYFAHVSPEGKTPWDWLRGAGYEYTYAGENLAVDFTDSTDVEKAWMNSPTHRANLLKQEYTRVGIAVAQGTYEGKDVTFVAQYFATPPAPAVPKKSAPVAAAPKPASITPASEIAETPAPEVLGAQSPAVGAIAVGATSPGRTMWYLVGGLGALFALLYALTLVVHARKKIFYAEIVFGGLALLVIACGILAYNGSSAVALPHDIQSNTVSGT